jgi:type IV pilus assembly protein PilW
MKNKLLFRTDKGFTIVELLVVMAIAGLALTGVLATFRSQQKSYSVQDKVVVMQQNLRVGMYLMEREIRMAGFNPTNNSAFNGFLLAEDDEIQFQRDDNENGASSSSTTDPDERTTYGINTSGNLGRASYDGSKSNVSENVDALNFVYLDNNSAVLNSGFTHVSSGDLDKIRGVQITMIVRAPEIDPDYSNNIVYRNQQNEVILSSQNDNFRRRLLTTTVRCRNMGL